MNTRNKLRLLIAALLLGSSVSANGLLKLEILNYGFNCSAGPTEAAACALIDAEVQNLANQINADLPTIDQNKYLAGSANAAVTSSRGLGVDYTPPKLFVVGIGAGLAANLGNAGPMEAFRNPENTSGFGAQTSAMFGLSLSQFPVPTLGPVDLRRATIYFSFLGGNLPASNSVSGSFNTFGMMAQYRLYDPQSIGFGLLKWGGLHIGTGFNYSSLKVNYKQTFDTQTQNLGLSSSGDNLDAIAYTPTINIGAGISTFTVPVEASTSVRFLYIANLILGGAVDINLGVAENKSKAVGLAQGVDDGLGTIDVGGLTARGTLDFGASKGPDLLGMRIFAGPQLDIIPGLLSFYTIANYSFTSNTLGVAFGAKAGF